MSHRHLVQEKRKTHPGKNQDRVVVHPTEPADYPGGESADLHDWKIPREVSLRLRFGRLLARIILQFTCPYGRIAYRVLPVFTIFFIVIIIISQRCIGIILFCGYLHHKRHPDHYRYHHHYLHHHSHHCHHHCYEVNRRAERHRPPSCRFFPLSCRPHPPTCQSLPSFCRGS